MNAGAVISSIARDATGITYAVYTAASVDAAERVLIWTMRLDFEDVRSTQWAVTYAVHEQERIVRGLVTT